MKRALVLAVAAAIAIAAALPARAAEGVITYKSLSPDAAFTLAKATLDQCRKEGYEVAVVVIDRFGGTLVSLRDRFTGIGALDIAAGKAWTAVNFARDTSELIERGNIGPTLAGQPKVTLLAGGMVIRSAGSLVGGIGVAGAPGGDKDEACAKAGIAAIQDQLDF